MGDEPTQGGLSRADALACTARPACGGGGRAGDHAQDGSAEDQPDLQPRPEPARQSWRGGACAHAHPADGARGNSCRRHLLLLSRARILLCQGHCWSEGGVRRDEGGRRAAERHHLRNPRLRICPRQPHAGGDRDCTRGRGTGSQPHGHLQRHPRVAGGEGRHQHNAAADEGDARQGSEAEQPHVQRTCQGLPREGRHRGSAEGGGRRHRHGQVSLSRL
mmetsp:Transcript_9449/g.38651  ORF Transcript_9449/g.38651 Transcript_9449/m.38651 type:complete len:219 (+) Transcript_9449:1327-1983(+)